MVREILVAMDSDWRECMKDDQQLHLMTTRASSSHFCTKVLFNFNLSAGVIYFVGDNVMAVVHQLKGNNNTLRPFPLKVLFPFEAEQSPLYEVLVVFLFLHGLSIVYTIAILNSLISALVCLAKFCNEFIYDN